jgi:hypothetical protein
VHALAIFPAAAILAVAIISMIRRRAESSVALKWNGAALSTRFLTENVEIVRASVERHFMCQFTAR